MCIADREDTATVSPFVTFEVHKLEAEMINRTYNQEITLKLGSVQVKQDHKKEQLFIINTPMASGTYLIAIKYINVS